MGTGQDAADVDPRRESALTSPTPSSATPPALSPPIEEMTDSRVVSGLDPEPFSIESVLPDRWSRDSRQQLGLWRQGDLLRRPGVVWLGPGGDDEVTGTPAGTWDFEPVAAPDLVAPYGVIASQTCDIQATGPGSKHPFVEVHPVFDMSRLDPAKQQQIRHFGIRYLVALTSPPEPDGFWVADLRLVLSVSKSHLLTQTRVTGFDTEQDRLNFAEVLAVKRRRVALHDALSDDIPKILDDHIRNKDGAGHAPDWHEGVEQVRLDITGDRLGPESVTLVVVCDHRDLPVEERAIWREADAQLQGVLKRAGCTFGGWAFTDPDVMSARWYRNTVPIDVKQLRRAPSW